MKDSIATAVQLFSICILLFVIVTQLVELNATHTEIKEQLIELNDLSGDEGLIIIGDSNNDTSD